jgi:hypothetical protein
MSSHAWAMPSPLGVIEACRQLLERGHEPSPLLQGLTGLPANRTSVQSLAFT